MCVYMYIYIYAYIFYIIPSYSSSSINFHHPSFCKVVSTACRTASTIASATSTAASLATAMATTTEPKLIISWVKNMLVKMGSSSPRIGVKIPKIFELPPPRKNKLDEFPQISRSLYSDFFLPPNKILKMEACEV